MAKKLLFSDQLRLAIAEAEVSRYRICKDTGLLEPGISRFMRGDSGLSMESVDVICEYLDLALGPRSVKRPKKKRKQ